jgi:hypothetical protein
VCKSVSYQENHKNEDTYYGISCHDITSIPYENHIIKYTKPLINKCKVIKQWQYLQIFESGDLSFGEIERFNGWQDLL